MFGLLVSFLNCFLNLQSGKALSIKVHNVRQRLKSHLSNSDLPVLILKLVALLRHEDPLEIELML